MRRLYVRAVNRLLWQLLFRAAQRLEAAYHRVDWLSRRALRKADLAEGGWRAALWTEDTSSPF